MALTEEDLCNLALSEIGEGRNQITDYASGTDFISKQCRLHYPRVAEELPRMHKWNCCRQRDQLTTATYPEHGWDYYATLPSDCLRLLSVVAEDTNYRTLDSRIQWELLGRDVLVNYTNPYIVYIKEPALADMDSLYTKSFYTLLGSKLAIPLLGDKGANIRDKLLSEVLNVILPEARSVDGFEDDNIDIIDSDWIDATYSSYHIYDYPFNQKL